MQLNDLKHGSNFPALFLGGLPALSSASTVSRAMKGSSRSKGLRNGPRVGFSLGQGLTVSSGTRSTEKGQFSLQILGNRDKGTSVQELTSGFTLTGALMSTHVPRGENNS